MVSVEGLADVLTAVFNRHCPPLGKKSSMTPRLRRLQCTTRISRIWGKDRGVEAGEYMTKMTMMTCEEDSVCSAPSSRLLDPTDNIYRESCTGSLSSSIAQPLSAQ